VVWLPVKLDEIDVAILRALLENGRKPFSQIAELASVSTPTVESRVRKMFNTGLIQKIIPVLDVDKIESVIAAQITLKVDFSKLEEVTKILNQIEEIRSIYVTASENNLVIKVFAEDVKALQDFLTKKIAKLDGVTIASSNVITKIIKEEPGVILKPGLGVRLICDFCGREVKGKPEALKVDDSERFFCCKTCRASYREKYRSKIESLTRKG